MGTPLALGADPSIRLQPKGGKVAATGDFGFTVLPGGTPPFTFQWYFDGSEPAGQTNQPLVGETNNVLWLENITAAQAGVYSVLVSNTNGEKLSTNATLTVRDPLILDQDPSGGRLTVAQGATNEFWVLAGGIPPLTYQWYFKGDPIEGATNDVLVLENLTSDNDGGYYVVVENASGKVQSDKVNLTVAELSIFNQPEPGTAPACGDFVLEVVPFGTPPLSYQWYYEELESTNPVKQVLLDQTNAVLVLSNLTVANSGIYSVEVTNLTGAVESDPATLIVQDPAVTRHPLGGDVIACTNFMFEAVACGSGLLTYQWYLNGVPLAGETNETLILPAVSGADTGRYWVVVSNEVGLAQSSEAVLRVQDPAILAQPEGGLVAAGTDYCFDWLVCGGEPLTYQWFFNGLAIRNGTNRFLCLTNLTTTRSGDYWAVAKNEFGRVESRHVSLDVAELRILTQPLGGFVLQGEDFQMTVEAEGRAPLSYQWYLNGMALTGQTSPTLALADLQVEQSGDYHVRVSNPARSLKSASARLTVLDLAILTQPQGAEVLAGTNVAFSVVAMGPAPITYQWYFNGAPLADQTNDSLLLTNVTTAQAGGYSVRVFTPAGSILSATANLKVDSLVLLTQPSGKDVPAGTNYCMEVLAWGTPPLTYQWFWYGIALTGATNPALCLTNLTAAQGGSYSVTVANGGGEVRSADATLRVEDPFIWVQPQGTWASPGDTVRFEVQAAGTAPLVYQWRFKNINLPGQVRPVLEVKGVTKAKAGKYSVRVRSAVGSVLSSKANLSVLSPVPRSLFTGEYHVSTGDPTQARLQILLRGNGSENALSFSMGYDLDVLSNPSFEPAEAGAAVFLDTSRDSNGLVGVTMALPPDSTFLRTNQQVIGEVVFDVAPGQNPLLGRLSFDSFPVPLAVTNAAGSPGELAAEWMPSGIVLQAEPALHIHSGLFRQQVLLSNPTDAPFTNVLVNVYGLGLDSLGKEITLQNAYSDAALDADQDGLVDQQSYVAMVRVPDGESVVATMEFYVPDHQTPPLPSYLFSFGSVKDTVPPLGSFRVGIRARRFVEGEFMMEFLGEENKRYYIQYADTPEELKNPNTVKTSAPRIRGTGRVMLWFDTGPPRTESVPEGGMRFYKVMQRP